MRSDKAELMGSYPNRRSSAGWGNDTLIGSSLPDILRGGAGSDMLTGKGGSDRFQFFKDDDHDTIQDFSEADDVIDLTAIFSSRQGNPGIFVKLRVEVIRIDSALPMAHSILELNYDGRWSGGANLSDHTGGRYA